MELETQIKELWTAAQTVDPSELAALISANADIAEFNEERGALQMRCKEGSIVASLPLSAERVDALRGTR